LEQLAAVGKSQDGKTELSSILILIAICSDVRLVAELFRAVHWVNGTYCPHCKGEKVIGHGSYGEYLHRYKCKDCKRTFNDKTGTLLQYRHIKIGNQMMGVWALACASPNGISINSISS